MFLFRNKTNTISAGNGGLTSFGATPSRKVSPAISATSAPKSEPDTIEQPSWLKVEPTTQDKASIISQRGSLLERLQSFSDDSMPTTDAVSPQGMEAHGESSSLSEENGDSEDEISDKEEPPSKKNISLEPAPPSTDETDALVKPAADDVTNELETIHLDGGLAETEI